MWATDGQRLDDYGVAGQLLHTPGHTPGSLSLLLDSGEALVGDLLMGGFLGGHLLPQRPGFHYFAQELAQGLHSLDQVLAMRPKQLFVGHGGPLEAAQVGQWRTKMAPIHQKKETQWTPSFN